VTCRDGSRPRSGPARDRMVSAPRGPRGLLRRDADPARDGSPGVAGRPARVPPLRMGRGAPTPDRHSRPSCGQAQLSRGSSGSRPRPVFPETVWNARLLGRMRPRPRGVPLGFRCMVREPSWNSPAGARVLPPLLSVPSGFPRTAGEPFWNARPGPGRAKWVLGRPTGNPMERRRGTSRAFARGRPFQSGSRSAQGKPHGTLQGLRSARASGRAFQKASHARPERFPGSAPDRIARRAASAVSPERARPRRPDGTAPRLRTRESPRPLRATRSAMPPIPPEAPRPAHRGSAPPRTAGSPPPPGSSAPAPW